MLHRTACHACLLQQPNIEKSESEFHFGTTYAVAVVATWRIGAKLPCVAVCTCRVPRTCRGVKKFRFSMGTISFIFRSKKTISISVKNLGYMHILPFLAGWGNRPKLTMNRRESVSSSSSGKSSSLAICIRNDSNIKKLNMKAIKETYVLSNTTST